MTVLSVHPYGNEYIICVLYRRTPWQWLTGKPATRECFRGSGTVWRSTTTWRRPGAFMERFLADMLCLYQSNLCTKEHREVGR